VKQGEREARDRERAKEGRKKEREGGKVSE